MRKRLLFYFITAGFFSMMTSCSRTSIQEFSSMEFHDYIHSEKDEEPSILFFSSIEELNQTIDLGLQKDSRGLQLRSNASTPNSRTELNGSNEAITLEELVPEKEFRALLNDKGEIVVNDTIYIINKNGTFFTHIQNADALRNYISIEEFDYEMEIEENLYKIGDFYRQDTFKDVIFEGYNDEFKEDYNIDDDNNEVNLRSSNIKPLMNSDIKSFEEVRASKFTIVGKFMQKTLAVRNSKTIKLPGHDKRRLNCAVFDYNYRIRQSIGITAKIQKKMWYGGWAKVKYWEEGGLVIGYKDALISFPYKDKLFTFKEAKKYHNYDPNLNLLGFEAYYHANRKKPKTLAVQPYLFEESSITIEEAKDLVAPLKNKIANNLESHGFMERDLNVAYPIFTKDRIYIYFSGLQANSDIDESEMTWRFAESGVQGITISFNGGVDEFGNIKKYGIDIADNPDVVLHAGSFYAAGYYKGWAGYRLYW